MEIKVGVVYTAKELILDIDGSPDEVVSNVESALKNEGSMLWLTDRKGRRIGIPVDKIAYVEIGEEDPMKRVGFGPG